MKRLLFVLLAFFIITCSQQNKQELPANLPEKKKINLDQEIIQTPPRLVSSKTILEIQFRDNIAPDHFVDLILDKSPFECTPDIKGTAKWITPKILHYIPDTYLKPGQEYTCKLLGKILLGKNHEVNDFTFSFKVAEQEVMQLSGDFVPSTEIEQHVLYNAEITFAQPVDITKLIKDIQFSGPSGKINFEVKQKDEANKILFMSEAIPRSNKGQSFKLTLPKSYTARKQIWAHEMILPAISTFKVLAHSDMSDPSDSEMTYGFRFSDPLQKNTDLSGYLTITPQVEFSVSVQNKYLKISGPFNAESDYEITIARGLPSAFGPKLSTNYTTKFSFENIKPEIQWLSEGIYLPSSNDFKLQFKSVNVKQVYVEITEIYKQNIGFFLQENVLEDRTQKNRNQYDHFSYRDLNRVGQSIHNVKLPITNQRNHWTKTELDLSPIFKNKKNSLFIVQLQFTQNDLVGRAISKRSNLQPGDLYFGGGNYYTNPCEYGYYYSRGTMNKLLISSNIGLTVKLENNGIHVFATDVLTARPVPNLDLGYYSFQNKLVESQRTNADGHAFFKGVEAYIYGQHASGIALIKLNHHRWQINNFDVSGHWASNNGTNIFMYTDRGVHRPGDLIHFSGIIRYHNQIPPAKQPVQFQVKNARGQIVLEKQTECGENGHIYFPIQTGLNDPTGNWDAEIKIGEQTFHKTLKVETVKPNRLKIDMDFPDKIQGKAPLNIAGIVTSKYLFGTPSANLRTHIRAEFSESRFQTAKFKDFNFNSPVKHYQYRSHTLVDKNLDENGQLYFKYEIPAVNQAPGLIHIQLNTTVYEKGGNFVEHKASTIVYPYQSFVGVKDVFGHWSTQIDQKIKLPIVVVDLNGQTVKNQEIRVREFLSKRHWWYDYDRHDRRDFRSMETTFMISERTYTSTDEIIYHEFNVEDYGQHYIEITNMTSGHETGVFFYASRWGDMADEGPKERNSLQIFADKNQYQPGDIATLSFKSPDAGIALVTVEQGYRVIDRFWHPLNPEKTSFTIQINESMLPNCYVSVSLIQPQNQNTNDLPMRRYGIKTLYIEDANSRLPLTLNTPEALSPKELFQISVTSHAKDKATYTIAVVDEGLLYLTGFQTPSPWDFFFKKIRLGIQTLDNFDEIFGVLFPDIEKFFTIGGGLAEAELREKRLDKNKVQRFKPVALYQKPVTLQPGQTNETEFIMPNYVGSVRVMVIGASGHSYASLEKTIPVTQPLMVLPTVPRVIRPADIFDVPVSVFVMDSLLNNVVVSVSTSSNIQISGETTKSLQFHGKGEKDTRFKLTAGNDVGIGNIKIQAASQQENADNEVELSIASANPFYTEVLDTTIAQGKSLVLVPKKFGLDGTNKAILSFSRMPDIQLEKRYKYLIRYPYGCIEQTISSVFPQLYLGYLLELKSYKKDAITKNVNAAIAKLSKFKIHHGFSYWPVSNNYRGEYNDWGTTYLGHFLVEAQNSGYHIPPSIYNHWLNDAKRHAKTVNSKNHRYQAYRLYVLALSENPNIGAMNMLRENYLTQLDPLSRSLLAAAYALSGQKEIADEINRATNTNMKPYREYGATFGSSLRDLAMITYLTLQMDDEKTGSRLLNKLSQSFHPHGWYSTQETVMGILALGSYMKETNYSGGLVDFHVYMQDRGSERIKLTEYQKQIPLEDMWDKEIRITANNNNPLFVSLFIEGIPFKSRIKTESNGLSLTREFYDEDGDPLSIYQLKQGTSFWMVLSIQSTLSENLENVALSNILPAGWEVINTRLSGEQLPKWVNNMRVNVNDYQDIRDDRVNFFFNLYGKNPKKFAVKLNATFTGQYTMPPLVAETMYSPDIYARKAGFTVEVK